MKEPSVTRETKFRQAAFFYLHVAILYESIVWVLHRDGSLPARGPIGIWLAAGAVVAGLVFIGLWRWQNPWVARAVWALGALRLPALLEVAFAPPEGASLSATFYLTALVVVLINLWLLARAAWDL